MESDSQSEFEFEFKKVMKFYKHRTFLSLARIHSSMALNNAAADASYVPHIQSSEIFKKYEEEEEMLLNLTMPYQYPILYYYHFPFINISYEKSLSLFSLM